MSAEVEMLRRLAEGSGTAADSEALTACLRQYLDRAADGLTLEAAFGLAVEAGGEPWYARERRARRDAELRDLVRRFGKRDGSVRAHALWLQVQVRRYESTAWLRDRLAGSMPEYYRGNEREYLYRAFKSGPVPSGERQLRAIVGSE